MSKKKKNPTKKLLIIAVIILAVFAIGAALASAMGWLGGSEATMVETAEAKLKTITQEVSASGKIQPKTSVMIRPEVSGEIILLAVEEGDYVEEGDLLIRIKQDLYQSRIEEVEASLLTQKARLEQARANLIQAESEYEKQKKLYERQVASEATFIQAKQNYMAQKAAFEAAEYQVKSVEAQLQQAREELAKTVILAPQAGTITKLAVEQGERVLGNTQMAGTEMMSIAVMDNMEVQVEVNENDIVNISLGDTTRIQVDAYPERVFEGVVTEISNSAEIAAEGTTQQVTNYMVKVGITTPHNLDLAAPGSLQKEEAGELSSRKSFSPSFKPGMTATVDVQTETVQRAVAIPIQAVTVRNFATIDDSASTDTASSRNGNIIPDEDLRKVVFLVKNGKAQRQQVTTGISDNTHIQIIAGIETGDQVIIGPYRTLSEDLEQGDAVNVNNNQFEGFRAAN